MKETVPLRQLSFLKSVIVPGSILRNSAMEFFIASAGGWPVIKSHAVNRPNAANIVSSRIFMGITFAGEFLNVRWDFLADADGAHNDLGHDLD